MNKTLPNPYYLFSFQNIASKERISFIPEVITSNVRYDKFRFIEGGNVNPTGTPPEIWFGNNLGQWYYSIYEQLSPTNTDIRLTYNKLESGRAILIVGDDTNDCFFEPYISNDEDFSNIIYVSEEEQYCISGDTTPSPTPSVTVTATPTLTPTNTPSVTPTMTPSATPSSDADANLYLSAVVSSGGSGITPTISAATTNMFISLKSAGLYDKIYTLYPMLGGIAGSCKFNAVNPVDNNAAHRLTFGGGGIFSQSVGYQTNGFNTFANTHFNPDTENVPYTSFTMFNYVTVDGNAGYDIGGAASSIFVGMASRASGSFLGEIVRNNFGFSLGSTSSALGANIISRFNSNSTLSTVNNGGPMISIPQDVNTTFAMPSINLSIGVYAGVGFHSDKGLSTVGFAEGLTQTEVVNLRDIITTFNTTIGR
jgi:hypothetical protein